MMTHLPGTPRNKPVYNQKGYSPIHIEMNMCEYPYTLFKNKIEKGSFPSPFLIIQFQKMLEFQNPNIQLILLRQ